MCASRCVGEGACCCVFSRVAVIYYVKLQCDDVEDEEGRVKLVF